MIFCIARVTAASTLMALNFCCNAEELVIGQVATFTNVQPVSKQLRLGAQVCFDAVNARGGVHGALLKLVTKDRSLAAADSVAKTRELIAEAAPLALVGLQGTAAMEELVKNRVLADAGMPVVGIRTGAVSLHEPVNPLLFHTRASYAGEIAKIATQLNTIGLKRVAVFHENSVFGKEGLALTENALKQHSGMLLAGSATYEPNSTEVAKAAATILGVKPQGIIMVANSAAAAEFYKHWRTAGGAGQVMALSLVDGAEVVKRIGKEMASGLVVTQVVPEPSNRATPLVREWQNDMKKYGGADAELNQTVLEGYLAAKVLVEALRIAGPAPNRKKLRAALESMREYDAGGVVIGFSPGSHTGSKFVELAIILRSGKLMR